MIVSPLRARQCIIFLFFLFFFLFFYAKTMLGSGRNWCRLRFLDQEGRMELIWKTLLLKTHSDEVQTREELAHRLEDAHDSIWKSKLPEKASRLVRASPFTFDKGCH